ncbi:FtsX-like permease family protein [Streptomyces sp. NPDC086549]|uniref:FtsX-like permease family protein n=1 Tax=Streptomyces sp. NPDC086549 TaxID=3365752 RepID=UPI0038164FB3
MSEPHGGLPQTVRIADCAQLRLLASLPTCSDGDAFLVTPRGADGTDDMTTWKRGTKMRIGVDGPLWAVPHVTATIRAKAGNPQGEFPEKILLATPKAAGATAITHSVSSVSLTYVTSTKDIQDRLRTTAAQLNPGFAIDFPEQPKGDLALNAIKRALLAGVAAVLLLIAASMVLGAVEQLRDRKRVLTVLVAFGTRRRTLGSSILWQTVLPVMIGLLVAGLVGTTLGSALLGLVGRTAVFDWGSMLAIAGIGVAAAVMVTLLTLPTLWRSTRPEGLRYE